MVVRREKNTLRSDVGYTGRTEGVWEGGGEGNIACTVCCRVDRRGEGGRKTHYRGYGRGVFQLPIFLL